MSRWSRRTQEEKDAILQKQENQQQEKIEEQEKHDYMNQPQQNKLLEAGHVPIFCKRHGWTYSYNYTLEERMSIFNTRQWIVTGNCKDCKTRIKKEIPISMNTTMIYLLVFIGLKKQYRLTDMR